VLIVLRVLAHISRARQFAYGLAPASVVAPVGSVGVVVNAVIATVFLKEKLRVRDVVGLMGVIGGVVLVIVSVPETPQDLSVHNILSPQILLAGRCYWWLISLMIGIIIFICRLEPRYAQEYILVWLLLCSFISSTTVAAARGVRRVTESGTSNTPDCPPSPPPPTHPSSRPSCG
jgi:hypothetical protein